MAKFDSYKKEELIEIVDYAKEKGMRFYFSEKRSTSLSYSSSIELSPDMSVTQMYNEVSRKLEDKGFNYNDSVIEEIKKLVS